MKGSVEMRPIKSILKMILNAFSSAINMSCTEFDSTWGKKYEKWQISKPFHAAGKSHGKKLYSFIFDAYNFSYIRSTAHNYP